MASRMKQLLQLVRKSPLANQVLPLEAQEGLPVPHRPGDGRVYAILTYYGKAAVSVGGQRQGLDLFGPLATITADWQNGRIVEFVDLCYRNGRPLESLREPVGRFPHPALAGVDVAGYEAMYHELLDLCDLMFDGLVAGNHLPVAPLERFAELFSRLAEPCFADHYRTLAPRFCQRFWR